MGYMQFHTRDLYWLLRNIPSAKHDAEIKKEIRRRRDAPSKYRYCVSGAYDWSLWKYPLGQFDNIEEADEYFRDYEFIEYVPTYYDCTGQRFTGWYYIWQKPDGEYWCYHMINVDC